MHGGFIRTVAFLCTLMLITATSFAATDQLGIQVAVAGSVINVIISKPCNYNSVTECAGDCTMLGV